MKKLNRPLAVILTALMLLSIIPISLSASAAPVALNYRNATVKVAPTVTPSTFEYGLSYGDLKVEGGEVWYEGEKVEGYFGFNTLTTVPTPREDSVLSLYFFPADETKYKKGSFRTTEDYPIENWPTITVTAIETELQGTATAAAIDPGSKLSDATITATVINKKTGEPIEGGTWAYDSVSNVQSASKKVFENGTYSATWTLKGHADVATTVQVNVNDKPELASGISVYPTVLDDDLVWSPDLTYGDIKFEGGRALYEGQPVTGTFKWQSADTAKVPGTNVGTWAFFVPDDPELVSFFAKSAQGISMSIALQSATLNVKTPNPIEIVQGTVTTSAKADTLIGFEFDEYVKPENVTVKFSKSLATLEAGTYNDITTTISYANHKAVELNLPIKIIGRKALPITKTPEAVKVNFGYVGKSRNAVDAGFEFEEGFDASKVMVEWGTSVKDLPLGKTEPMEMKVYLDTNYEEVKVTLPIEIVKRPDTSKFCFIDLTSYNSNNEGQVNVTVGFHDQYKNGTATVKLTDGTNTWILGEDIPPTYTVGEKAKNKFFYHQLTEPGTYTFTAIAEYTPGDADTIYFTDPVVESYPMTITYEKWIKMTCINTRYDTSVLDVFKGKQIAARSALSSDEFAYWEILDSKGRPMDPAIFGLTEDDMKKSTLAFYVPIDEDFTIAARDKFYIPPIVLPDEPDDPDNPDDPATELTLWEQIVAFFQGIFGGDVDIGSIPVIGWLARLIELIIAFFQGFFNGLVGK